MTTYRERQHQKALAVAEAERALLRATHAQNEKLNRLNKERGQGGKFECPPACPQCHPDAPTAPAGGPRLGVVDLRGRTTPVVLRGKRGRCQECKVKLASRRGWFCEACKARRDRLKRRS